jgi:signal transduction histidine kinase
MHDGEDRPVGVIEAINKRQGAFSQVDVETTAVLADLAGVAVEKARLIAALQDANQRLSELDELKSNFIAIASHELRTPLSVILGYVSFLREAADPALADQMDSVLNAAVRLRSLIQDMLNLGYVDTGDMQLELEIRRFDLTELVKEFIQTRDESAQALQHQVTLQIPTAPAPVDADRSMLELMIGNLLDNAFKYTPPGGRIAVAVEHRPTEVWLKIQDSGIGIPEAQLERIFDRFHQVQHPLTRRYEGMGLGLAIVKELTDLHQGRLWAESVVDEGSTFYLALPLAAA